MESGHRSRKRKQCPSKSDKLDCIFTRSKSQIYLHRHRSGYARADSIRNRSSIKPLKGTTANSLVKQVQSEPIVNDQITNHVSVKDLRVRRVFSPNAVTNTDDVSISEADLEPVFKKTDAIVNPNISSVADVSKALTENIVTVADELVQMTPIISESEHHKAVEEKSDAVNEIIGTEGSMNKSRSSVTSLRGRRKVFKSPSSFSYRRLLPYLKDLGNDDSSDFEIVGIKLPEQAQKSSNKTLDLHMSVESSNVGQKSHEDDLNDTLEECEQMTPPDSDIYRKSKTDKTLGVLVKPTSKLVLNPCSRMKLLQNPTSFSHRRLLPFLTSVSADNSCASKGNLSVKLEKATEQNQRPPTLSLLHQNINTDESTTTSNSGQPSTAEESDSLTSTLIQIDTSFDIVKTVPLASNDNALDARGPDTECSESTSQLEENLQPEPVKCDGSIKSEQSSPKNNLKCVEEASSKAIETLPSICTEQAIDTNDDFVGLRNSLSKDNQRPLDENAQHSLLQVAPLNAPGINGEIYRNGILKRTPRGCRGICNCVNCTSYRLHADRSFEFSRNQMHDAEEVALELIEDLARLRSILERTVGESNSLATAKEKLVKEACEKALYKEEVARARLAQMNEDLSIHCRSVKVLRPSVTFANKIEEKVISKEEVLGKKND